MINKQELIAEFMGMKSTTNGWKDKEKFLKDLKLGDSFETLEFDTNIQWLLRVVKVIDDLNMSTYIDRRGELVEMWAIPFRKLDQAEHTELFEDVVHFIEWWDSLEIGEII